jgi:hypothetical protein
MKTQLDAADNWVVIWQKISEFIIKSQRCEGYFSYTFKLSFPNS